MTVTCTETAECDKWAEIVALAQQGNKKMLGVILQAFDIKLRKIAHTSTYKGFAEDGEQIERIAVVKALEKWGQRQDFEKLPAFIVSKSYTATRGIRPKSPFVRYSSVAVRSETFRFASYKNDRSPFLSRKMLRFIMVAVCPGR